MTSVVSCTTLMMIDVIVDPVTPRTAMNPFRTAKSTQMTTSHIGDSVMPVTAVTMYPISVAIIATMTPG